MATGFEDHQNEASKKYWTFSSTKARLNQPAFGCGKPRDFLANNHVADESASETDFVPPGRNCFEGDDGQEVAESRDQEDEVASCPQVMLCSRHMS